MRTFRVLIAMLMAASVALVAEAVAQTQAPPPTGQSAPAPGADAQMRGDEKRVEGQVRSINPSGTEITLTDGTRLVAPPGSSLKPGVLSEGATVVASYREENGRNVLTGLALKEPAASPPTEPRAPAAPSTPSPNTPPVPSAPAPSSPPRY